MKFFLATLLTLAFAFVANAESDIGNCDTCQESVGLLFKDFRSEHSLKWQQDYLIATYCRPMENETLEENCVDGVSTWWAETSTKIFSDNRKSEVCLVLGCTPMRKTWDCNECGT